MADNEDIKKEDKASSDKTIEKGKQDDSKPEWKNLDGMDRFKSEADLAKAYKELESKLGKQAEEIGQTREFAQVVQPLLDEIRNDPEIFARLDERLRKKANPDDKKDDKKADAKQEYPEMRTVASDLLIERFEEKHGISKLDAEEKRELRKKIGDEVHEMTGQDIGTVDLRRLNGVLEKAYVLATKDKLTDKSKSDSSEEAGMPGFPSSSGKSEETLTSEEAKVAERLGLTRQQYLAGKIKK